MKDPNLTAITRDGYYLRVSDSPNAFAIPNMDADEKKAQLRMDITDAAISDMSFNGVTVGAEHKEGTNYKLTVPLKDLNWTDNGKGQQQAEVSVFVVAFSHKNKPIGHFGCELVARTSGDPTKSPESLAAFAVPFTLPANTTRLRFVVRDAISGKIGTVDLTIP